ncbi:Rv3654c family TadE-like protein [Buchananella felis]|uniref:Rv3654c family TadE-like protein n=1 Tax=Buchananella felis TaxID=3231492 RepID=UPI003528CAD7
MALLLAAWLALTAFAAAGAARAQAAGAADMAALAAATALSSGNGAPCTLAVQVAARNGAALTSCQILGDDVAVVVTVPVPPPGGLVLGAVSEQARAGPAVP